MEAGDAAPEQLIAVAQAALWAEIPEPELRAMVEAKTFTYWRIGRAIRLDAAEIESHFGLTRPMPTDEAVRRTDADRPHWVYRLYAAADELLYVGISNRGLTRLEQHATSKGWWSQVATVRIEHVADRAAALAREAELIHAHRPPFNRAIPPA